MILNNASLARSEVGLMVLFPDAGEKSLRPFADPLMMRMCVLVDKPGAAIQQPVITKEARGWEL
jgi:hypothetical protein